MRSGLRSADMTAVTTVTDRRGAGGAPGLSDQGRWSASRASAATVAPRAVEQRRRDVDRQLWPSDSQFEWVRCGDRSGNSTHRHPSGGALDSTLALQGGKIMQVAPLQRPQTRRADRGVTRSHVVHCDKSHFVNRHLSDPILRRVRELQCRRSRRAVA